MSKNTPLDWYQSLGSDKFETQYSCLDIPTLCWWLRSAAYNVMRTPTYVVHKHINFRVLHQEACRRGMWDDNNQTFPDYVKSMVLKAHNSTFSPAYNGTTQ